MSTEPSRGQLSGQADPPRCSETTPSYSWECSIDGIRYLLSNDKSQLDLSIFNKAFAGDDVYWTGPMPDHAIQAMVNNSCVLGLYMMQGKRIEANRNIKHNSIDIPIQIGFGRLVTDYATLAYLTDVWIAPGHQGKGLGKWMMACTKEIIGSFPSLRRAILLTQVNGKGVTFYQRELGMTLVDSQTQKYGFMEYVPK